MKIPLYRPDIGFKEKRAVLRVLKSGKLSRGQETVLFEQEFARYVSKRYAISVNSGTSSLHILVRALGWKKGDEVITTPFSYIASSNCLLFEGVTPIFVDIDPKTLNIDPSKIEERITPRTKGILLVHILGLPADSKAIRDIAQKHKLEIIEDACEAIGRTSHDFDIGKVGSATVYGFHENKQLTTAGEGGMIVTDDEQLAERCRAMRDQGRSLEKDWINKVTLGFNFRMTEAQAAFGRVQLEKLDDMLLDRERVAAKYLSCLENIDRVSLPQNMSSHKRSWFFYFILFDNPKSRESTYSKLLEQGIVSSTNYFPPIYNFPMYKEYRNHLCPNTENVSKSLLVLPTFCGITNRQIEMVGDIIKSVLIN